MTSPKDIFKKITFVAVAVYTLCMDHRSTKEIGDWRYGGQRNVKVTTTTAAAAAEHDLCE